MTPAQIIQLIVTLEPLALPLINDIKALFAAHPGLTIDQVVALVAAIHGVNADTLAAIAADQAAHVSQ